MQRVTVRQLHAQTGAVLGRVAAGESVLILKRGVAVAELRPAGRRPQRPRLPDRSAFLAKFPKLRGDSGRFVSVQEDFTPDEYAKLLLLPKKAGAKTFRSMQSLIKGLKKP